MRLPINIDELLGGRAVEGDRIEYKMGWNPDAIYRSVCAFANGSPRATIETDEERTYFLIDIPCHPEFVKETLSVEQIGVKGGVKEPNVTKDVTKNITEDGVYWNTKKLKKNNRIRRIGGDKGGYWEVIENGTEQ